jgi:hypothetical protein
LLLQPIHFTQLFLEPFPQGRIRQVGRSKRGFKFLLIGELGPQHRELLFNP